MIKIWLEANSVPHCGVGVPLIFCIEDFFVHFNFLPLDSSSSIDFCFPDSNAFFHLPLQWFGMVASN